MTTNNIQGETTQKIIQGDCLEVMRGFADKSFDLVLTSPPYDNLRTYNGYSFDFEATARELVRVLKPGGVIVWVVNDATIKGSETGTSFRQALFFKDLGLNIHDTMIWSKGGFSAVGALATRYAPVFEYMFVLSKGTPETFNPIKDRKTKHGGKEVGGTIGQRDGSLKPMSKRMVINEYGQRFNVWEMSPGRGRVGHPAPFPTSLARDHILSWSNEGDMVLDPFLGSGTTLLACKELNRNGVGIEISPEYCEIAKKRIS